MRRSNLNRSIRARRLTFLTHISEAMPISQALLQKIASVQSMQDTQDHRPAQQLNYPKVIERTHQCRQVIRNRNQYYHSDYSTLHSPWREATQRDFQTLFTSPVSPRVSFHTSHTITPSVNAPNSHLSLP